MNTKYFPPYQEARDHAGFTQEQAAELLELSVKSISNYETGVTIPPPHMVYLMQESYQAPWLGNCYCNQCPLGQRRELPDAPEDLQQLSIEMALEFGDPDSFRQDAQRMLEISLDRVINDSETPDYLAIMSRLWRRGLLAEKMRILLEAQRDRPKAKHGR